MKKPTEAVYEDKKWNKRERLIHQLFLEYFSIPDFDSTDDKPKAEADKLAEALTQFLKGDK